MKAPVEYAINIVKATNVLKGGLPVDQNDIAREVCRMMNLPSEKDETVKRYIRCMLNEDHPRIRHPLNDRTRVFVDRPSYANEMTLINFMENENEEIE